MYWLGSVAFVGSWFFISVTRSVRKSLDEIVEEEAADALGEGLAAGRASTPVKSVDGAFGEAEKGIMACSFATSFGTRCRRLEPRVEFTPIRRCNGRPMQGRTPQRHRTTQENWVELQKLEEIREYCLWHLLQPRSVDLVARTAGIRYRCLRRAAMTCRSWIRGRVAARHRRATRVDVRQGRQRLATMPARRRRATLRRKPRHGHLPIPARDRDSRPRRGARPRE